MIRRECMLLATAVSALIGGLVVVSHQMQMSNQKAGSIHADEKLELRWASAGGGWRAHAANIGFANVFAQAGIFNAGQDSSFSSPSPPKSILTSMSSESGGAWFAAQFFYSELFYNATTQSTPAELSQFVLDWMDSYRAYTATFPQGPLKHNADCNLLALVNQVVNDRNVKLLVDNCALINAMNGNWANFVQGMLAATSAGYGDADLVSRAMTGDNRVMPLRETDVAIQLTLVPNSRIRTTKKSGQHHDRISYLGPLVEESDDATMTMFSVPICSQWVVSSRNGASYISNTRQGTSFPKGLVTYQGDASKDFEFSNFNNYHLYPDRHHASVLVDVPANVVSHDSNGTNGDGSLSAFRPPFGGMPPSVAQMTASSSAAMGFLSGLAPSTFAQALSAARHAMDSSQSGLSSALIQTVAHPVLEKTANEFYQSSFLDEMAVCSQWPVQECDEYDGRFVDGYAGDAITAALSIGHYHTHAGAAILGKPIKLILTPDNLNRKDDEPLFLLSYFNTTFNSKVEPGAFMWPSDDFIVPLRSPQIFADYLDNTMLQAMWEPIVGLDFLKTTRIQTTTIHNEAFFVQAGTPVDLLILQLSSDIPKEVIGLDDIHYWKGHLADLAEGIASSSELLARVRDFVSSDSAGTTPRRLS